MGPLFPEGLVRPLSPDGLVGPLSPEGLGVPVASAGETMNNPLLCPTGLVGEYFSYIIHVQCPSTGAHACMVWNTTLTYTGVHIHVPVYFMS